EKRYHSSRLEMLAVVFTLERLRPFLIGISFKLVTDCQALLNMNSFKATNGQMARWFALLQEYNFSVEHRPGDRMAHVDSLSRSPVENAVNTLETFVENRVEVLYVSED